MNPLRGAVGGFPIRRWFVLFYDITAPNESWLARRLPIGRFRHVSMLGRPEGLDLWVWYDVSLARTRLELIPGPLFEEAMQPVIATAAEIVSYPVLRSSARIGRAGFYCVPAAKHLLGLRRCALTPDGLYRLLLAEGGERMNEQPNGAGPDQAGQNPP
jgi:hypothetical protein